MRTVNLAEIDAAILSWDSVRSGIDPTTLPIRDVDPRNISPDTDAILSWRWDRNGETGRSVNVALALKYAENAGFKHLFIDLVSLDQTQPPDQLLADVAGLADLYIKIPVIAVYDESGTEPRLFGRTLDRPWILSEIRAYSQNAAHVASVGYRYGAGDTRGLSFANEVSVRRSTGYANCILEIMHGRIEMHSVGDFGVILVGMNQTISRCFQVFSRDDYLFATFCLAAMHEVNKHQSVKVDSQDKSYGFRTDLAEPGFEKFAFERFSLGPYDGPVRSYEWGKTFLLDGEPVAIWRTKMTSSFDRNWIEVLPGAPDLILDAIGADDQLRTSYWDGERRRDAFLRIDKGAPTPSISEHGADLAAGRWLDRLPSPNGQTLGFKPDLWR